MPLSHHLPWVVNIAAKIVLSRMPVSYRTWKKMGFFNAGEMDRPEYAFKVFQRHLQASGVTSKVEPFTCLELGPGDSVSAALIASSLGASRTYLVDAGAFATPDMNAYRAMAKYLERKGLSVRDISSVQSIHGLLSLCSGIYLIEGLKSLRDVPSASVDFVFSHASLQQVRRSEFSPIMKELRRIQKPDGVGSYAVSMRDLIGGEANDLRFSTRAWESPVMAGAGFYTNRLRYSQMTSIFAQAGFKIEVTHVGRWEKLPIPREKLATEFLKLSDDDLRTYEWDVLLR